MEAMYDCQPVQRYSNQTRTVFFIAIMMINIYWINRTFIALGGASTSKFKAPLFLLDSNIIYLGAALVRVIKVVHSCIYYLVSLLFLP
jgi:hypothetical protein